ncbi:MAG: hypothetical protein HDT12_01325 [Helicobacter sp.]|nr:hypothetical protein [Helicobacter sp.]
MPIHAKQRRNRASSLRASGASVAINNLGNPKRSIATPALQARNDDRRFF